MSRNFWTASNDCEPLGSGLAELSARPFELSIRAGKATMMQLNRVGMAISGMEEALVVHSLCHEDGLNQVEIALL